MTGAGNLAGLKATFEKRESELETIRAEHGEVQKRLMTVYDRYQKGLNAYLKAALPTPMPGAVLPEHVELASKFFFDNKAAHDWISQWMGSYAPEVYYTGASGDDYHLPVPGIRLKRNQPVAGAVLAVEDILRLLPQRDVVAISVMESTLSAYGSYHITFTSADSVATLVRMVYGRPEDLIVGTLHEVFEYVAKNYPYGDSPSDPDEEY